MPRNCLVLLSLVSVTSLSAADAPPNVKDVSLQDIQQSAIGLINIVTTPEVEGAFFRVEDTHREADLTRSTLGFGAEFMIRDQVFNGYWGAAMSSGSQDQNLRFEDEAAESLLLNIQRNVESIQVSAGLALPFNQLFKLRPYFTGSYARIDSETDVLESVGAPSLPPALLSWNADVFTGTGSIEAIYDKWYDHGGRLELHGVYSLSYSHNSSDLDDGEQRNLENSGWQDALVLRARWSQPTALTTRGRSWRWSTYISSFGVRLE